MFVLHVHLIVLHVLLQLLVQELVIQLVIQFKQIIFVVAQQVNMIIQTDALPARLDAILVLDHPLVALRVQLMQLQRTFINNQVLIPVQPLVQLDIIKKINQIIIYVILVLQDLL